MISLDARIERYLDKCPPAISGQHGHDQTFKVACALVWGFALSRDAALRYLEVYNARCEPPWSAHELAHKIDSALQAPQSKPVGYLRCFNE
jgi:putative DNA primase/helicase